MDAPPPITFATGQIVHWPAAPLGWAQVEELRRRRVRLCYRCRTGRLRFPIVAAGKLADLADSSPPLLPLQNPLRRGVAAKVRTFERKSGD